RTLENPVLSLCRSFKNFFSRGLPFGELGHNILSSAIMRAMVSRLLDHPRLGFGGYMFPVLGSTISKCKFGRREASANPERSILAQGPRGSLSGFLYLLISFVRPKRVNLSLLE